MHQPNLSPIPGKKQYALLDDYKISYGNIKIVVPQFFTYDGASIPSIGWRMIYTPFHPDVMAPALVHDWLYTNHQVTRGMADQIFYDLLIKNEANKSKSKFMHKILILAGETHWENSKKDIKKLLLLYTMIRTNENFDNYHFPVHIIFNNNL